MTRWWPVGLVLLLLLAWSTWPAEDRALTNGMVMAPHRTPADIQPGDVLIENHEIPSAATCGPEADGGLWRPLIRGLFNSGYQHVRIAVSGTHSLENLATGIARTPLVARNLGQFELWRPRCPAPVKQKALALIEAHLGEPFGFVQGGLLVAHKRFGVPVPDVPGMTCSELVSWAYAEAGYPLTDAPHQAAPWDFRTHERSTRVW